VVTTSPGDLCGGGGGGACPLPRGGVNFTWPSVRLLLLSSIMTGLAGRLATAGMAGALTNFGFGNGGPFLGVLSSKLGICFNS
jgi:hypothetical protein